MSKLKSVTMKMLFVLFISLLPLISIGQKLKDSIKLRDGRTLECKITDVDDENISFTFLRKNNVLETFTSLNKVEFYIWKNEKTVIDTIKYSSKIELTEPTKEQDLNKTLQGAGNDLVSAGKLLKSTLIIPLVGGGLGAGLIAGGASLELGLAVVGGSSIIGYILAIVASNKIIKAGEKLNKVK